MAVPFSLSPFETISDVVIAGDVARSQSTLALKYTVTGTLDNLVVPPLASTAPSRRDKLWQTTCFEAFIGMPNASHYWEINVAPKGDWNLYRFESYRQGMAREMGCHSIKSIWQSIPQGYQLVLNIPTEPWLPSAQPLEMGISTILQTDRTSHWALVHPGKDPDFHHRDSFTLFI
ncbi:MAG: DOMON-like domain-containing protein [Cyanobacteria bacterium P01_D01_bin.156]